MARRNGGAGSARDGRRPQAGASEARRPRAATSETPRTSDEETFRAHCRRHGLAVTGQRLAIFAALAASREHPSAEQIFLAVRDKLPKLSLATVYKNLEALRAAGAIGAVNTLHEQGRYESVLPGTGAGTPHHHFVCVSCKKVLDLHDDRFDALRVSPRETQGFEVRAVRVQVEGLCPDCRAAAASGPRKANSRRR
jgi:Fur family transcriptional regulator, peroxide stress response regulator